MWDYRTSDDPTVRRLFRTTREKLWKVLFKAQKDWPDEEEDQGLNAAKPPSKVCYDLDRLYSSIGHLRIVRSLLQEWLKKAKDFKSPAPQPEDPRSPLLLEMLIVAPYKAPEKKEKKKKTTGRAGPCTKDQLEAESEETHASSNQEEEEEEEDEVGGGRRFPPYEKEGDVTGRLGGRTSSSPEESTPDTGDPVRR
jgi:hypothetical protein